MATGDKLVNLDDLKTLKQYSDAQDDEIKSALILEGDLLYIADTVANNTVVLTTSDVSAGDTIYYKLEGTTGYAASVNFYDSSSNLIGQIGKASGAASYNDFKGKYVIPQGFATAKVVTTDIMKNLVLSRAMLTEDISKGVNDYYTDVNLFDESHITTGIRGVPVANPPRVEASSDWFMTDYIPVNPGDVILTNWTDQSNYYGHIWYDKNRAIVGGELSNYTSYTIPSGVAYARMCGKNSNKTGATIYIKGIVDRIMWLASSLVDTNVFDSSRITTGMRGVAAGNPPRIEAASGWFITDYIPVEPGYIISTNWNDGTSYYGHIWYNKNKEPISGSLSNANTYTVPANAYYAILSGKESAIPTATVYISNNDLNQFWLQAKMAEVDTHDLVNLFNPATKKSGVRLGASGGNENIDANCYVSDYIPVLEGSVVYVTQTNGSNNMAHVFYDELYRVVTSPASTVNAYTVPATAKYLRVSGVLADIATMAVYSTAINRNEVVNTLPNEYMRYPLHNFSQIEDGFLYAAFPGATYYNGKIVACYRIAPTHVTTTTHGGVAIYEKEAGKQFKKVAYISETGTSIVGELRDPHLSVSRDGTKLFLSGFTTYIENGVDKHSNYIMILNDEYEIVNYYYENNITRVMWGNVLETPEGYLLHSAYSDSEGTFILRSTAKFTGTVSGLTFESVKRFGVTGYSLSECDLGYHNNKLVCMIRIDNGQSVASKTANLEGSDGWVDPVHIGIELHAPVLIPMCTGKYLVFSGARCESGTMRYPVLGLLDTETLKVVCYGKIDETVTGYSGYIGIVPCGGDDYETVYYVDNGATAVFSKKVNMRMICPKMQYLGGF